jgi:hypothetical protein
VLSAYWGRLAEEFPEFQFVVYDPETEEALAQGHSIPCVWDGTLDGLPAGIDEVVQRRFGADSEPGTLSALAVEVPRRNQGRGLSRRVIGGMGKVASAHGLDAVIVPLRPVLKERYSSPSSATWRGSGPTGRPSTHGSASTPGSGARS